MIWFHSTKSHCNCLTARRIAVFVVLHVCRGINTHTHTQRQTRRGPGPLSSKRAGKMKQVKKNPKQKQKKTTTTTKLIVIKMRDEEMQGAPSSGWSTFGNWRNGRRHQLLPRDDCRPFVLFFCFIYFYLFIYFLVFYFLLLIYFISFY